MPAKSNREKDKARERDSTTTSVCQFFCINHDCHKCRLWQLIRDQTKAIKSSPFISCINFGIYEDQRAVSELNLFFRPTIAAVPKIFFFF